MSALDHQSSEEHRLRLVEPVDNPDIPMTPWHEDVYRLSKLWRWLVFREIRPKDPAYFIENALDWREEYEAMCMWSGESC